MLRKLVPPLVYFYVTCVGLTSRIRTIRGEIRDNLHKSGRHFIYAFWHQRQVLFTYTHRGANAAILVSRSKDGEMIAETMRLSNIAAVRGSSSRGGAAALRELMEAIRSGFDIGITPDGPKGPAREIKEGIVYLAQKLAIPILPITNSLSFRLEIKKAWDHFHIPLPFSRAVVIYGDPIEVGPNDDLSAKAAELKIALNRITTEADLAVR